LQRDFKEVPYFLITSNPIFPLFLYVSNPYHADIPSKGAITGIAKIFNILFSIESSLIGCRFSLEPSQYKYARVAMENPRGIDVKGWGSGVG